MQEPAPETEGAPPPEEAQNRTFIILAIALGGVFLIGLVCIGVYILFIGPGQRHAKETQAASVMTQNAQIAMEALTASAQPTATNTPDASATALSIAQTETAAVTPTAVVVAPTNTPPPTATRAPTNTPIQVAAVTDTPSPTGATPTSGPSPTGTRATASPTPLVGGLKTATPTRTATPTQLPGTGFADQAGVPGLIVLGVALIAIVIITRRLRLSLR
ncbi:MAG: hypothetical protein HY784_15055 [Chloroflexi bacterium]|nr:hypothetical protein [Chloroflexota bacterium]